MNADKIRRIEAMRAAMPTMASRKADRDRIAKQLEQFLATGGQIQPVESHTTAMIPLSISDRAEANRSRFLGDDRVSSKQANSRGGKA